MKGMNTPQPLPPALLAAYLQAGELQFNIKALETHLFEVNQRINALRSELEILNRAAPPVPSAPETDAFHAPATPLGGPDAVPGQA